MKKQLIGTVTTNENGEAIFNYTGRGAGEITFIAESEDLTSESYSIMDALILEEEEETITTGPRDYTFDSSNQYVFEPSFKMKFDLKSISNPVYFRIRAFCLSDQNKHIFSYPLKASEDTPSEINLNFPEDNEYHSVEIIITKNSATCFIDNVKTFESLSKDFTVSKLRVGFLVEKNQTAEIIVKNLIIYPIKA